LHQVKEEKDGLVEDVTQTLESQDCSIKSFHDCIEDMETIASALVDEMSLMGTKLAEATSQGKVLSSEVDVKTATISNLEQSI